MVAYSWPDMWGEGPGGDRESGHGMGGRRNITLDCLMPNGILIPLRVAQDATLEEIKEVSITIILYFLSKFQTI